MAKVFDIETNAVDFNDLHGSLKTIHCIVIGDTDTGVTVRYNDRELGAMTVENAVQYLQQCSDDGEYLVGHNIQGFDIPAIQVMYPEFSPKLIHDTTIMSKLMYPNLRDLDFNFIKKNPKFPKHMIGWHSLASWGYRLGEYKDDFSSRMKELGLDPWGDLPEQYEKEREDYCEQDVIVNMKLYEKLMSKGFSEDSIQLEQDIRRIVTRQEKYGFAFDVKAARVLQGDLVERKLELEREMKELFPSFYVRDGRKATFKKDMKRWREHPRGAQKRKGVSGFYENVTGEGEYQKVKLSVFNPGSRDHIANRLQKMYGWKPKAFGADGKPTVDERVLSRLNYPPVKHLLEYLMVNKRLGQLAEGKEAWLKQERNGRIHGRVDTMGAVTSRMTHSKPNVAQTPANGAPFGKRCRALFTVAEGNRLVGADADALELRLLAGYMARWDGGEYIKVVLDGKKEDGTDIHSRNRDAVELKKRDTAKTWFYAFIYGAGDYKLGEIIASEMDVKPKGRKALTALGKRSRDNFQRNLPALGKLVSAIKAAAKKRGRVKGLDGRLHPVRAEHAALNTLLQGAGAIVMKRMLVLADNALQSQGYKPGADYEFVANVHDELQVETHRDFADDVARTMERSLKEAGEYYDFKCPITGTADIGSNWSETH